MNFDSNKEKKLMNLNIMRCDRITIKKLKSLIPLSSKSENYYIKITVNNKTPQTSEIFSFKNTSEIFINQTFYIESFQEKVIKEIKFELISQTKNIKLYTGTIINQNFILDEKTGDNILYLSDKKGSELIILYYSIEYKAIDSFEFFDKSVKHNKSVNKEYLKKSLTNFSKDEKIKDEFIQNLLYVDIIIGYCFGLIKWKNTLETLLVLLIISVTILYFKFIFIYFLPFSIILFHFRNKNKIDKIFNEKNNEENLERNRLFFVKLQENFNNLIENYESLMKKIITGNKSNIIKVYKALILTIISNIFLFYFNLFYLINWRKLLVILIWIFFLSKNLFLIKFCYIIKEMFSPLISNLSKSSYIQKMKSVQKFLFNFFIPIFSVYNEFKEDNSDTYISIVKSQGLKQNLTNEYKTPKKTMNKKYSSGNNLIKFELYENERWWIIVGWTKNLLGNNQTWCRVDKPFEFCDKSKIFLPNDENNKYQWSADWKIEINDDTDEEGWMYSDNFDSEFSKNENFKYVRRRKWFRYANKI